MKPKQLLFFVFVLLGSIETYANADFKTELNQIGENNEVKSVDNSWSARYQFVENWENATDPTDGSDTPWYSPDFNDSAWPTLTGPLDGNNWNAEYSAYYLRRVFTMSEVKDCSFFLTVNHDDYVKVYLNGTLVGEDDFTGNPSDFSIPSGLLVEGENLLAIYIDDRGGGGRLLDYEFHRIRIFTAQTDDGVDMTFKVISESEKTCMVGTEEYGVGGIIETYNGEITIPSVVNGYTVTRIGKWAFSGRGGLTSVTIPETVESIGTQAFNFTGLTAITLPSNLKTIEDGVFQGCTGITSVTIPASVTSIAGGTFDDANLASIEVESGNQVYDSRNDCNAIIETATNALVIGCKNTVIPDDIEIIGIHAFVNCYGLESITIPSSVKSIGHRAFYHTGLTSITIPSGVEYFNGNAITGCTELTSIVVESGNTVYDCRDNCNAIIESSTNTLIAGCKNTIIPNTVTRIGSEAFYDHGEISSIEIPSSVTSIGDQAFRGSGLTSINIPEGVTSIDFWAFAECGNLTSVTVNNPVPISLSEDPSIDRANATLYVPAGSLDAYANADYWRDFKRIAEEGDDIQLMGQPWEARYQFVENWENATDPMDGDTPWYSPDFDDSGWPTLTGPLDTSNWEAEGSAYYLRRTFTMSEVKAGRISFSVRHDDGVKVYLNGTLVGEEDFTGETHEFFASSSLLAEGENLLAIYIEDRGGDRYLDYEFHIDHHIFIAQTAEGVDMTFKVISESEKTCMVGTEEYGVGGIIETYNGEITIPSVVNGYTVTRIGKWAFSCRGGLTSVTIPETVESIGTQAFNFTGLTAITLPSNLKTIEDGVFQGCTGITSVTIPASVTSIAGGTFDDANLASIEVESGNQVYDSRNDCNAIIETATNTLVIGCQNTAIPDDVEIIGTHAFVHCYGLESLTIPSSVTSIGGRAFFGCSNLTSVSLSENLKTIEGDAFGGCESLTSIVIPASVTSIGDYIFAGCIGLTSIVVEDGNTVYDCRDNCNAIIETSTNTLIAGCKNTIIPNTVTCIGIGAFNDLTNLTSIEIPSSVTTLKWWAFHDCGLTSINIPAGVTTIEAGAFEACPNLTSVTVNNPNPISLSEDPGIDRANATLYVPAGSLDAYANADYWRDFKRIAEEGDDIQLMGQPWEARYQFVENWENATDPMDGDTPWYSPDFDDSGWPTLTGPLDTSNWEAEGSAYYLRRTFTMSEVKAGRISFSVRHDDGVKVYLNGTLVGEEDFTGETHEFFASSSLLAEGENLLAIYIVDWGGDRYLDYEFHIDHRIFTAQTAEGVDMTFKVISESEKTCMVGDESGEFTSPFPSDYNGGINIPSEVNGYTVKRIGKWAFSWRGGLTSVSIPETVESIGTQAFNFTGLTAITLPSNLKTIEDGVFQGCTGITSVIIPASVTSIAGGTFDAGNMNLASIEVESGNQVYDSRNGCNAIIETATNSLIQGCKNTVIPDDIEIIGIHAFIGCTGLTSIDIPSSVTSIGWRAFCGHNQMNITLPENVSSIGDEAFLGSHDLSFVIVKNPAPIALSDGCNIFSNQENATLIVPAGCKAAYEAADYWREFKRIIEDIHGDVNGDEDVDVVDVVDIARYVVGTPAETFVPILADIDNSGEVNIGDAVALVNEIAGEQNFVKAMRAPRWAETTDEALSLMAAGNGLSLILENQRDYTAFQFDLFVPEGTDVAQMLLNAERKQKHQLLYNKVEEGHYRVAALSTSNHTFQGNDGELLSFVVGGGGDVAIRDIHFFTADGGDYTFEALYMNYGAETGIGSTENEIVNAKSIYDLNGRKMKMVNGKLPQGIYIMNGKKVFIK